MVDRKFENPNGLLWKSTDNLLNTELQPYMKEGYSRYFPPNQPKEGLHYFFKIIAKLINVGINVLDIMTDANLYILSIFATMFNIKMHQIMIMCDCVPNIILWFSFWHLTTYWVTYALSAMWGVQCDARTGAKIEYYMQCGSVYYNDDTAAIECSTMQCRAVKCNSAVRCCAVLSGAVRGPMRFCVVQ